MLKKFLRTMAIFASGIVTALILFDHQEMGILLTLLRLLIFLLIIGVIWNIAPLFTSLFGEKEES